MSDKLKGNVLFLAALAFLVLAIVFHGSFQILFGIIGGVLGVVSLYYEFKVRIKRMLGR